MIQTIESIRRQAVVPVSADQAFEVFTSRMTEWWPSEHRIGSAPIEEIVIERVVRSSQIRECNEILSGEPASPP